jgi:hypothetical protein
MLSISISYWDLLKCLYFVDTTERGKREWKEAQRQDEESIFFENFKISTIYRISVEAAKVHYGIQVHPMTIVAKHIPNNEWVSRLTI